MPVASLLPCAITIPVRGLEALVVVVIRASSMRTPSCAHSARKVPNAGEDFAQSGPILTAPSCWKTRREWRNINDYRGAGDGNRTRVISLED